MGPGICRFSHNFRPAGKQRFLSHEYDVVLFIMRCFHRHLLGIRTRYSGLVIEYWSPGLFLFAALYEFWPAEFPGYSVFAGLNDR